MRLGQLLSDHLLVEAMHPDLHTAAMAINKKVAEQLKDIPIFKPIMNPEMYYQRQRGGWILGHLNNTPVSMMMDGSVTMEVDVNSGAHKTWGSIDKFLEYLKKRYATPRADQFIKRLSRHIHVAKDGSYIRIQGWNIGEIAKYVGLELPVRADVRAPQGPPPTLGRSEDIVVTPKSVMLVHHDSDERYLREILAGRDTTNGYVPDWPPEVIAALKELYRKEAGRWVRNDVTNVTDRTGLDQLELD